MPLDFYRLRQIFNGMNEALFDSPTLALSKWLAITAIHCALAIVVVEFGARQRRLIIPLPHQLLGNPATRIATGVALGLFAGLTIHLINQIAGRMTGIILHAGFLSIWYLEIAILLAYGFFKSVFDDELPFEITLFISFILMVNAGYFTLMLSLSLLRAPSLS